MKALLIGGGIFVTIVYIIIIVYFIWGRDTTTESDDSSGEGGDDSTTTATTTTTTTTQEPDVQDPEPAEENPTSEPAPYNQPDHDLKLRMVYMESPWRGGIIDNKTVGAINIYKNSARISKLF